MTRTFSCPSCGAPLEPDGSSTTVSCPYCSASVIVPEELREPDPSGGFVVTTITINNDPVSGDTAVSKGSSKGWFLLLFIIAVAVALPIILTSMITTRATRFVSEQVNVVITESFNLTTEIGPLLTSTPRPSKTATPSPTPGYASLALEFGSEGIAPGQFQDARLVAVDPQGRIYAGEYTGGRLQIFDPTGKYLDQIALNPELPVQGVGVDRKGTIYISQGGEILKYSAETLQATGKLSPPRGKFYSNLTISPTGKIVAALTSAPSPDDIVIMDGSGKVERTIPGAFTSQTNSPELDMTLAVDGLGNIYALGSFNSTVVKYSPDGKFTNRFGSRGNEPGQFRSVQGIAVDGQGRIFISSASNIQAFDNTGRYLGLIDLKSTVYFGIATDDQGNLYVAARTRVLKFQPQK